MILWKENWRLWVATAWRISEKNNVRSNSTINVLLLGYSDTAFELLEYLDLYPVFPAPEDLSCYKCLRSEQLCFETEMTNVLMTKNLLVEFASFKSYSILRYRKLCLI